MSNKMAAPDQQAMGAVAGATPVPDPHPVNPAPGISEEATTKPDPAVPETEEGAPKLAPEKATSEPDPAPGVSVPDLDVPDDTGLQFLDVPDDTGLQFLDVPDDAGLQLVLSGHVPCHSVRM